jgi:hypothetical protein
MEPAIVAFKDFLLFRGWDTIEWGLMGNNNKGSCGQFTGRYNLAES